MSKDVKAEVEENEDIISLLASQGAEDDDEEVSEEIDTDTEDIEELKARISKRNKSLKKSKQAVHRVQEEKDALLQRIEELERKMQAPASTDVEAQKREQEEALKKWRDSVEDDPSKAVDFANWQMTQMQENFSDVLVKMQQGFDAKLAEIKGEINPEKMKYRDQIGKLRQNPAFAELDDNALMAIIRSSEGIKIPRGGVGGQPVKKVGDPDQAYKEAREQYAKLLNNGL